MGSGQFLLSLSIKLATCFSESFVYSVVSALAASAVPAVLRGDGRVQQAGEIEGSGEVGVISGLAFLSLQCLHFRL